MANSLSFNGTALSTHGAYVVRDFVVPTLATPKLSTSEVVGRHGGYLLDAKYQIRDVTVPMLLFGYANTAAFYTAIDSLNAILDITLGPKQLIFDYNSSRYLNAIAASNFDAKKLSLTAAKAQITFQCVDPFWYAVAETTDTIDVVSSPQTLSLTPSGNADSEPVFTILPGVLPAESDITIYNITSNTKLTWATPGETTVNDEIIIDCASWLVKLNGVVSMATLDHGSVFPVLIPGVLNYIRITGLSDAELTYAYSARWL